MLACHVFLMWNSKQTKQWILVWVVCVVLNTHILLELHFEKKKKKSFFLLFNSKVPGLDAE